MSCYTIYYENGAKMMRPVLSEDEYRKIRSSEKQKYYRITGEKHKLVQMNYSCVPMDPPPTPPQGRGVVSTANGCGPLKGCTTPSNSVGMDVDFDPNDPEYEQKMLSVPERVISKKDELGLLMLERSARKGYHIVFRRRAELTQEENLRWASDLLGVKYDEGAKDITRVFFTTTDSAEDLLFVSPALFEQGTGLQPDSSHLAEKPAAPAVQPDTNPSGVVASSHSSAGYEGDPGVVASSHYQGIPYSAIISKYWELFNDGKEPCSGNRNALTFELAMALRAICDYSQETLEQVIPRYDGLPEDEWRMTISNALKEPRRGMPSRLRQVLAALKEVKKIELTGGTMTSPPPMPKKLPGLIKLLTKNVPEYYKPAVASAVFPALGAHLHGVRFRYADNVEHEATFMNLLVGCQSVGKGCIKKPIDYIMEDIKKRDEPNRRREAEWKRQNPSGKTKAKDPRPQDICIQMLIDNLTDAVFNQRVVDANNNGERFVYTCVDEVEALKKVTSRGTVDEVTLLIRKAFDNSMHGQERVGADSVSGIAPLRWNWNASTTPPNARRFFGRAVNDGTVSRLDVCTIIKEENDSSKMPVLGIYDDNFAMELKSYIDHLECANGLIECPQAKKLVEQLVDECDATAKEMESDAYRVLSYRGIVIAWLKGLVLYIAQGYKWTQEIADFVRWSLQYNLWCKMLYFGQQLEEELFEEQAIQRQSGPQNMLMALPAEFTKEDYYKLRSRLGRQGKGESTLRVWMSRKYVEWDEIANRFINKKIAASGINGR